MNYSGLDSHLFVKGSEIYKFKAQVSEINDAALCLGNVGSAFWTDNMKRLNYMDSCMNFELIMIVLIRKMLRLFKRFNG